MKQQLEQKQIKQRTVHLMLNRKINQRVLYKHKFNMDGYFNSCKICHNKVCYENQLKKVKFVKICVKT